MELTKNDIYKRLLENINSDSYKLFYLRTTEEFETFDIVKRLAKEKSKRVYTYDIANGLDCQEDNKIGLLGADSKRDLKFVLSWLLKNAKNAFVVFFDINRLLENDIVTLRAFRNYLNKIIEEDIWIKNFVISPHIGLPDEVYIDALALDVPLPTRSEIEEIVDLFFQNVGAFNYNSNIKSQFVEALLGMRTIDIINVMKYAVSDEKLDEEDIKTIIEVKRQMMKKDSMLDFINSDESINNVGGMENLKEWLNHKKTIIQNLQEARDYGVDIPKGILIFGLPGTGKSLTAKAVAGTWRLPLLRLDMGMILGPYVGQSEENIRKAIKIAEAIAPSILWIDELEKAFSGIGESGGGSSDVMKRIFGTFLTWMQEKTKPVFVIATANDISSMPPEFLRKGRFDEIFFVDLPKDNAKKEIIKIHLRKRKKENWYSYFEKYVSQLKGYCGADIESLVKEVVELSFLDGKNQSNVESYIQKVIQEFKPIEQSMGKKIEEMRNRIKDIDAKPVDK
ncbi:AAA family ATPase [Hydrogenobaculum acidophilum]